ncbi:sugar phosphate nucleotidyltransferase [Psychromonas aquimarina]|uniref:sugar phosphate nucleotidyltransferase n=1 Tax=Psychromonas aquimarina TaxID=444919 RepID=UPI00040297C1
MLSQHYIFYDNDVIEIVENIKPSECGELEITSGNNENLKCGDLNIELLDRDFTWVDTGTYDSLMDAG